MGVVVGNEVTLAMHLRFFTRYSVTVGVERARSVVLSRERTARWIIVGKVEFEWLAKEKMSAPSSPLSVRRNSRSVLLVRWDF